MSSTTLAVPGDGDDEQSENSSNPEHSSGPRKPRHIPTREQCLQGIASAQRPGRDGALDSAAGQRDPS